VLEYLDALNIDVMIEATGVDGSKWEHPTCYLQTPSAVDIMCVITESPLCDLERYSHQRYTLRVVHAGECLAQVMFCPGQSSLLALRKALWETAVELLRLRYHNDPALAVEHHQLFLQGTGARAPA